jgi:hypothetical protein
MKIDKSVTSILALGLLVVAGCSSEEATQVSFKKDVFPIINTECLDCHSAPDGQGYQASGLNLGSYEGLMKGTKFGPVIVPGESVNSTLVRLIEGKADPSIQMPHGGIKLSEDKIEVIKKWVNQGAKDN